MEKSNASCDRVSLAEGNLIKKLPPTLYYYSSITFSPSKTIYSWNEIYPLKYSIKTIKGLRNEWSIDFCICRTSTLAQRQRISPIESFDDIHKGNGPTEKKMFESHEWYATNYFYFYLFIFLDSVFACIFSLKIWRIWFRKHTMNFDC